MLRNNTEKKLDGLGPVVHIQLVPLLGGEGQRIPGLRLAQITE